MNAQLFLSAAELIAVLNAHAKRPDPRLPQKRLIVIRSELPALSADQRYLLHHGRVYRVPTDRRGTQDAPPQEARLPEDWLVPARIPTETGRQLLLRERADARGTLEREFLSAHWLRGAALPRDGTLKPVPLPGSDDGTPLYLTVRTLRLQRLAHLTTEDLHAAGTLGPQQTQDAATLRAVRSALVSGLTGAPTRSGAWVWLLEWSDVGPARANDVIARQLGTLITGIQDLDTQLIALHTRVTALSGQRRKLASEAAGLLKTHALGARTIQGYRVTRGGITADTSEPHSAGNALTP